MLEAEMEEHLGYAKNDAQAKSTDNARNAKSSKTVRGDFGEVQIETPRHRDATFLPKIVAKRQTSVGDFGEKIISLYACGMTTREIEEHLAQM